MYINRICERAYLLLTSLSGTDTFSGETTLSKLFCLPSVNGSTLKGKNFDPYKHFSFRIETFGVQESEQEVAKIVSLEKDGRKFAKCIQSPWFDLQQIYYTLCYHYLLPHLVSVRCYLLCFCRFGLYCRAYLGYKNRPAGTCCLYNVALTSMQRHLRRINVDAKSWRCIDVDATLYQLYDVASALMWRCRNAVCPLEGAAICKLIF